MRGIGRWTAQMFLIFSLGRLDVFPHDDLGIRSAIQHLYGLEELPVAAACVKIGERLDPVRVDSQLVLLASPGIA